MKKILLLIPLLYILLSFNTAYADETTETTYYTSSEWQYFDTTEIGTDYVTFQYENPSHEKAKLWIYNHENNNYILYWMYAGSYGAIKPGEMKYCSENYSSNTLNPPKVRWVEVKDGKYEGVETIGRVCIYENGALESQDSFTPITPEPLPMPEPDDEDEGGIVSGIVNGLKKVIETILSPIISFFEAILNIYRSIGELLLSLMELIQTLFNYVEQGIGEKISAFISSLNPSALSLVQSVFEFPIISELLTAVVFILLFSTILRFFLSL